MQLGSPARAALRIAVYAALTLPLMPVQLLANALGIRPVYRWLPVGYHWLVCRILGLKVRVHGRRSDATPTLFVGNHTSYLDIEVLSSLIPGSFVAKSEVATWPFFSWLAKLQRTVFVERRVHATARGRDSMTKRLDTGDNLILFAEGTTGDGTRVLPFRPALLAAAQLEKNGRPIPVQPFCIQYTSLDGIPMGRYWRPFYAWMGDAELAPHLWQMAGLGEAEVIVAFLDPVDFPTFGDRKKLADHCRRQVAAALESCNTGRLEDLPPQSA